MQSTPLAWSITIYSGYFSLFQHCIITPHFFAYEDHFNGPQEQGFARSRSGTHSSHCAVGGWLLRSFSGKGKLWLLLKPFRTPERPFRQVGAFRHLGHGPRTTPLSDQTKDGSAGLGACGGKPGGGFAVFLAFFAAQLSSSSFSHLHSSPFCSVLKSFVCVLGSLFFINKCVLDCLWSTYILKHNTIGALQGLLFCPFFRFLVIVLFRVLR